MKFYIKNFGCRLNQSEGDAVREKLLLAGWCEANPRESEIVFINGCTVTSRADQKVRQFIHKVYRENPSAKIVITGCTALAIEKNIPIMKQYLKSIMSSIILPSKFRFEPQSFFDSNDISQIDFPDISGTGIHRTRAWVKIQDGCDRNCSYCIVPLVRGKSKSRKTNDVVEQVKVLVNEGFKEIVLTGVDIGDWKDENKTLADLLIILLKETTISRIRLSSLEPPGLSDEIANLLASENRIAPHLHIPIQSASPNVLKAMNREFRISTDEILEKISQVRSKRPDLCFGTDIIVGFPTETDDEFNMTLNLLKMDIVSYAHIFPFSKRPNTLASELKPLSSEVINRRRRIILSVDRENRKRFAQKFVGKPISVLIENVSSGKWTGHSPNYIKVFGVGNPKRGEEISVISRSSGVMTLFAKYGDEIK